MSKIAFTPNASGTGTFSIASPGTNTDRTLTLPDATGTVNVSGLANEVPAGSAGAPAIYPTGDSNTGIFFPAADTIAFAEGGAESARFDNTGRLTLNNSLKLSKTTATSSGEVLGSIIAEATYASPNYVASMNFFKGFFDNNIGFTFNVQQGGGGGSAVSLEAMRIDSNGNLLVGTTSAIAGNNSAFVSGNGNSTLLLKQDFSGAQPLAVWHSRAGSQTYAAFYAGAGPTPTGSITTNGTTTAYVTSSDYRLKENVQPMQDALAVIAQLNPVTYTWKADGSDGQGFIAHELQAVVPDCVSGEKDAVDAEGNPQYQGVDTSFLVATLVKAVQELTARIAALEAN
jgi:hypothetical protein